MFSKKALLRSVTIFVMTSACDAGTQPQNVKPRPIAEAVAISTGVDTADLLRRAAKPLGATPVGTRLVVTSVVSSDAGWLVTLAREPVPRSNLGTLGGGGRVFVPKTGEARLVEIAR